MHGVDGGPSRARVAHHAGSLPAPHVGPRCWHPLQLRRRQWSAAVRAFGSNDGRGPTTSGSSGGKGGLDPSLEMAVPPEQRPVNELSALRQSVLYSWVRHVHILQLQRLPVLQESQSLWRRCVAHATAPFHRAETAVTLSAVQIRAQSSSSGLLAGVIADACLHAAPGPHLGGVLHTHRRAHRLSDLRPLGAGTGCRTRFRMTVAAVLEVIPMTLTVARIADQGTNESRSWFSAWGRTTFDPSRTAAVPLIRHALSLAIAAGEFPLPHKISFVATASGILLRGLFACRSRRSSA